MHLFHISLLLLSLSDPNISITPMF